MMRGRIPTASFAIFVCLVLSRAPVLMAQAGARAGMNGEQLFKLACAACHGADGKGNQELGAPNLSDKIWLYGSDEADLVDTIANSRTGVMPAWAGRLDPATINALTVYVHTLGGGK